LTNLKQQQQQNAQQQNEFSPSDPDQLQNRKSFQKLFDQLATDDMKKMIAQLEDLMKNADKDKPQRPR